MRPLESKTAFHFFFIKTTFIFIFCTGFVTSGKVDTSISPYLRHIIAEAVSGDPLSYCDAFLGKPNKEYCEWIQKPNSWGGAIELSVLSVFYGIEIVVVNVLNSVVNRFGEDKNYGQRVFLLFDGIHYDPLYSENDQVWMLDF